jgi:hypothetical protein
LILERVPGSPGPLLASGREEVLVLVPGGQVEGSQMPYDDGAFVRVLLSGASDASPKVS